MKMSRVVYPLRWWASIAVLLLALGAETHPVRAESLEVSQPSEYVIRMDEHQPELRLYRRGQLVRVFPVALGTPATPTPVGNWHIVDKQTNWGHGFGTRWLALDVPWGIYGIHGTNLPESIGRHASHGCVRMANQDVEQLYRLVPIGTPVYISGNPLEHRRNIEFGNVGSDVQAVQRRLHRLGWYAARADGRFGSGMQLAVMLFELSRGLPMDAIVGSDDYTALGLGNSATG